MSIRDLWEELLAYKVVNRNIWKNVSYALVVFVYEHGGVRIASQK